MKAMLTPDSHSTEPLHLVQASAYEKICLPNGTEDAANNKKSNRILSRSKNMLRTLSLPLRYKQESTEFNHLQNKHHHHNFQFGGNYFDFSLKNK